MSRKPNYCLDCGIQISRNGKRCMECALEKRGGVPYSEKTKRKMSVARKRAWENGIYANRETEELRKRKSELRKLDWARGVYGSREYREKLSRIAKKRQPRIRVTVICGFCGKEYTVKPSVLEKTKYCSRECRGKMQSLLQTGENNPSYGATGDKNPNWRGGSSMPILRYCEICNVELETTPYQLKIGHGRFCSHDCMNIWHSEKMSGENSPLWKGGHSHYRGPNWKRQAEKARNRDNHLCQNCGKAQKVAGKKLDVHHIVPFRLFDDYVEANQLENLIVLCNICHKIVEHRIWAREAMADLADRFL